MKYVVIEEFTDLQDNNRRYRTGDLFPRTGFEVNAERINSLSTNNNRRGFPVIKAIEEDSVAVDNEVKPVPVLTSEVAENVEEEVAEKAIDVPPPVKRGRKKNENK